MCGIFGGFGFSRPTYNELSSLKSIMHHRGPDSFNTTYIEKFSLFLAHSRLAIIDKSISAQQPMLDPVSGNILVFNGEIYNFKAIRSELLDIGHIFISNSDSEVILKGYLEWGRNILQKLNGMFAFAIWDNLESKLFLARDRLGEKPLYYFNSKENEFFFSSEIKPLYARSSNSLSIQTDSLAHYFTHGFMPHENSIFREIKKLKPAHYMEIQNGKVIAYEPYWNLKHFFINKNYSISYADSLDYLNYLLKSSTTLQQVSDVSLGLFLSGGVDSSLIAASIENRSPPLQSFCAGFLDKSFDERSNAFKVANQLGTNHMSFEIANLSFSEIIKPFEYCDEPFSDTSTIPMYYLSKFAKEHVTVCLSGDGGDELFGGYTTYSADYLYQLTSFIPRSLFAIGSKFTNHLPTNFSKVSLDYKLKSFLYSSQKSYEAAHDSWRNIFNQESIPKILNPNFIDLHSIDETESSDFKFWGDLPYSHFLDRSMYFDLNTWLPNDILYKVDRMCMSNSLESRAPFLDHRIVEFAASLPYQYKLSLFNTKILLKGLARSKHGINFSGKKKLGFSSPTSAWILNHSNLFQEYLLDSNLFNPDFILNLVYDHINCKTDNGYKIINLASLVTWKNTMI